MHVIIICTNFISLLNLILKAMSTPKSKTTVATAVAKSTQSKHTASTLLLAVAKGELPAADAAKLLPKVCTRTYAYTNAKVLVRHAKWVGRRRKYVIFADKLLSAAESILRHVPQQTEKSA